MALMDVFKKFSKKTKIIIAAGALAVIAAAVICIVIAGSGYTATTMRLLKIEGTVNLEDSRGGVKPVSNNLRFQSGDALSTGADGLASVGLDNTKIITLQNESRAEFSKKRKQLELKLTKGAIFFNVTEKLRADEKFEIKTSTMTAGIRGTSGMVYYDAADGRESLLITDGSVEVSATNPETGETKTAMVEAGQEIKVYLFYDRTKDSVAFELASVNENNLPKFAAKRIAENEALNKRVCDANNWKKENVQKKAAEPESTTTAAPTTEATTTTTATEATTTTTKEATTTTTTEATESTTVTESTTAKPTSTPTPKPKATSTPKPTSTPTPKPTSTPTPTPTMAPTPTPKPTPTQAPSNEPSLPNGCTATNAGWNLTYNGHKVYICYNDEGKYFGYYNGSWQLLRHAVSMDDGSAFFYIDSTGELYYTNT